MKVSRQPSGARVYAAQNRASVKAASPVTASGAVAGTVGAVAPDTVSVLGIPEAELTPRVRAAIMSLMAEVDRLRAELSHVRDRLDAAQTLADQDALLPVLNRRAFVREMSRMLGFAERYDLPVSLIYLDMNGFKAINDGYGHAAGDAVLAHVVGVLADHVRESDVLGRLGGDEFGVILAKADFAAASRKATSLAEQIQATPFAWNGCVLPISISTGAYQIPFGQSSAEALIAADQAMYAIKRGRDVRSVTQ